MRTRAGGLPGPPMPVSASALLAPPAVGNRRFCETNRNRT
jgi:hypothetical protein